MAVINFKGRVLDTTTTTGTGDVTLSGTSPTGFRTFNAAFGTGVTFHYTIQAGTEWETGEGHLSAATTLVRDVVIESSNSNAAVSFSAGTKNVFCGPAASIFNAVLSTGETLVGPSNTQALTGKTYNGLTISSTTGTLTLTNGKTLSVTQTLTLSGTDSTTMTFPTTSATIARTDAAQTFTGVQTFSSTIVGSVNGNAATATALQNARTIGGVSFDGTGNITVSTATGGFTISGGDLALGANNITMSGSLGTTGTRLTKGWFTDLQVTNAISGSITGNAATVTTNANLTGHVTSTGNAAVLGSFTIAQLNTAVSDDDVVGLALNQTITGIKTFSPTARTSGSAAYVTINTPADTGITTATEAIGVSLVTASRAWVDGTVALQREIFFAGPTYNKTTTSATFTDAFTLYITPPVAGTGVTFTRGHTLGIVDSTSAASSITGGLVISATIGTTATSVGIGGGNINAGGTITSGSTINAVTGYKVNGAATSGKILIGDGTNFVPSTPTFPNASATIRKMIVSDGTNWVASTETWATPSTSGNLLVSDGTNWTSSGTYAGNTSITTVGTIGTGTWQGTVINSTYGGTGINNGGRTLTISTNSGTISFTSSVTLTVAATASVSGTNTGDQTTISGNAGTATTLQTSRNIWGQSFNGSADVTGSLTSVSDITGGASSMTITAGTGASRTMTLRTTTSGSTATAFLTGNADQSSTFGGNISGTGSWTLTGGAGNMTIVSGTGASRTMIFQTTTSGSTATTALTLNADQSATFAGAVSLGTSNALTCGTIELGAASDTTLARIAGGRVSIEGVEIATASNSLTFTTKTWNGVVIDSTYGGTGVNNSGRTLTIGSNSGTLSFGNASKTLTINNNLTLSGTDSTTITFQGTDIYVGRTSTDTLTNKTLSDAVNSVITPATTSVGYLGSPQNSQNVAYTLVLTDAGKHIFHPASDTTARTYTIPANSSVAYPVGTYLTFINENGAGVITIAITTDTMRLAGTGTTGSRTLAANGVATAMKVTSTSWIISGNGLT